MKHFLYLTLLLSALCAAGCAGQAKTVQPQPLRVGGNDAVISSFLQPVKETFEEEAKIPLTIVELQTGETLSELYSGRVDAIIATSPLKELLHEANLKKVSVPPGSLSQVEVGKNRTVVFLQKNNRIKKLSQKQLKSIFTGKVKNWHQLGGPNQEIIVVWDGTAAAENESFTRKILKESPLLARLKAVESFEDVRKTVMETPGAIGIAPSGFIAPGVKVPRTPAVSAPVIIVAKGTPSPQLQRLIEILKDAAFI